MLAYPKYPPAYIPGTGGGGATVVYFGDEINPIIVAGGGGGIFPTEFLEGKPVESVKNNGSFINPNIYYLSKVILVLLEVPMNGSERNLWRWRKKQEYGSQDLVVQMCKTRYIAITSKKAISFDFDYGDVDLREDYWGQIAALPQLPWDGIRIGAQIGTGAFGTVHKATMNDGTEVAVKTICMNNSTSTEAQREFAFEALFMQPNMDFCQSNGCLQKHFWMDYSLHKLMCGRLVRLQLNKIYKFLFSVCIYFRSRMIFRRLYFSSSYIAIVFQYLNHSNYLSGFGISMSGVPYTPLTTGVLRKVLEMPEMIEKEDCSGENNSLSQLIFIIVH
uniref:Protein kinase domain-containing protein n=1 Tax=Heterorhabditis bacteriophora TaxID=37862 RepID=A0A1I7W8Q5_HETBA